MLHTLSIRDLAIVDSAELELGPGMTAITGETGAGKSLMVDALHLLLGGRADRALVRSGAEQATVTGLFSLGRGPHSDRVRAALIELGVPLDDAEGGELLVRRSVGAGGRGRAFLNDVPVTVGTLAKVMEGVVDIMSQHEHQSLTSAEQQRELLDAFGDCGQAREVVAADFTALRDLLAEQARLATSDAEKAARVEYLDYQIEELEQAAPAPGQLLALEAELRKLGSVDRLLAQLGGAEALLNEEERAAIVLLDEAQKLLAQAAAVDPTLEPSRRAIDEARTLTSEAARDVARARLRLEADPARLEEVAAQVDLLRRLARKHAVDADQLGDKLGALREERDGLQHASTRLVALEGEITSAKRALSRASAALSAARRASAERLTVSCQAELTQLAMADARLVVALEALPHRGDERAVLVDDEGDGPGRRVARHGEDHVSFLLQANPGEPTLPLTKVASGGELSRVALALRRALADRDPVPTYVFDEVDAAIGGATAEAVGEALKGAARDHQVICVTHLPQVAARADQHLSVTKRTRGKRTRVEVEQLDRAARVEELARMLGGAKPAETARRHARTLLKGARA